MGLFLELMTNIIVLVAKPFLLFNSVCIFGIRIVCLVSHTWLQLAKAVVNFHVDICWRIIVFTIALLSLPARVLTALQRERLLKMYLHEMHIQLESLAWDKKELEEQLNIVTEDRTILESILVELEDEHEKCISKIDLLMNELQDLKNENFRLNEKLAKKGLWRNAPRAKWGFQDIPDKSQHIHEAKDYSRPLMTELGIRQWDSDYDGSKVILKELLMHREAWEDDNKGKTLSPDFLETGSNSSEPVNQFPQLIPRNLMVDEVVDERREVAISQSLFSAILSLVVGMIIWKAEDPCMPLVIALFIVVGMSLKSVVHFFSTIKNRPASDAVALLSFNWFILGALTYPTLPRVAPVALGWLGLSS